MEIFMSLVATTSLADFHIEIGFGLEFCLHVVEILGEPF